MTPLEELALLVKEKTRRIFVAENPIDLSTSQGQNCVYVLELPGSSPGSAGGRIGGVGERKVVRLLRYQQEGGIWSKMREWGDPEELEGLELPYHATGLSVLLPDKTEKVVSGVVDAEFIRSYNQMK
ncbi:MAG: hypothetical protein ABSF09_08785 [Candidatus Bathyarchaeia archaeon]|jgi:hypothetical protein